MRITTTFATVTVMLMVAVTTQAETIMYSAVDIGSLGGTGGTAGYAVNNSGTIVGASYATDGTQHAFSYSNGTITDLGTLGGNISIAFDINNAGTIVGGSYLSNGNEVPFIYSNGAMTALNVSALQGYAAAVGINDSGVIVGSGFANPNTFSQPYDGFVDTDGTITIVSNPGGTVGISGINSSGTIAGGYALNSSNFFYNPFTYSSDGIFSSLGAFGSAWVTYASGINDAGTLVGYYSDANTNQGIPHAFSYSNGTYTPLGTLPGGSHASADAINNEGIIVGKSTSATSGGSYNAFIYRNGVMTDLNSLLVTGLPTTLVSATAINDAGQIVAIGANGDTYLLSSATPEPGSATLLALAGLCLLFIRAAPKGDWKRN